MSGTAGRVPRVLRLMSPDWSSVLVTVAAGELAQGLGQAVSPVRGGSFIHLWAAR